MAIWTAIQPPQFVWSRQPITYVISYSGITAGNSIQVQIIDTQSNTPLGEGVRYTATGTSGILPLDLAPLIDPYLSYSELAGIGDAIQEQVIEVEQTMAKKYHLRFREYSIANPNQAWTTEWNRTFTVLKGGLGDMTFSAEKFNQQQWMGHLFFPNTDGNAHPWLSFRGLFNNTIHLKEWRWLLYMHLGQNEPRIIYKVWYSDGTDITFYRYGGIRVGPYYGRLLHIPIGIEQASLNPYGKKPVKYTVTVTDYNISGGPSTTMAFMEFKVDNRPVHHPLNLIYRNCVGGIETIFLTGVKQLGGASFTKQISERNRYDSGQRGPASYFHSEGTVKFTAHTPYLSEQELILLYDLYNCTEMCGVISAQPHSPRRFYPMRVPEQDMPAIDRDAHLHSYKIEFETAGSFRNMPRNLFNFFRT